MNDPNEVWKEFKETIEKLNETRLPTENNCPYCQPRCPNCGRTYDNWWPNYPYAPAPYYPQHPWFPQPYYPNYPGYYFYCGSETDTNYTDKATQ